MRLAEIDILNVKLQFAVPDECDINVFPGDNVQTSIIEKKVWAPEETSLLVKALRHHKTGTFVDIGANTGYFSAIALSLGYKVIAFEANKVHKDYIMKTIESNGLNIDNFDYHEKFVSTEKTEQLFDGWSGCPDIIVKNNAYTVPTVKLDDVCSEALFMKIDVEGNEPDVLISGNSLIRSGKVPYIMFELTYILNDEVDDKSRIMLHSLRENNYKLYIINTKNLTELNNIDDKYKVWKYEYFKYHKRENIITAGCNMFAIHSTAELQHGDFKTY